MGNSAIYLLSNRIAELFVGFYKNQLRHPLVSGVWSSDRNPDSIVGKCVGVKLTAQSLKGAG